MTYSPSVRNPSYLRNVEQKKQLRKLANLSKAIKKA